MDPFNTSKSTLNSTFLQTVLNSSSGVGRSNTSHHVYSPSLVLLSVIVLGFPGNILVIVIYITNMKTSTRIYMFALAVADTAICMSGVVISLAFNHDVTNMIFQYILYVALTFSMVLLVFVSIERLIAVRRPHTFNMNPKRAKIYLLVFLLCTSLFSIANWWATYMEYTHVVVVSKTSFLTASALIMVTSYTLIGMTLLKKAIVSSNKIAGTSINVSNQRSYPSDNTLSGAYVQSGLVQSATVTVVSNQNAKEIKTFKSMFLLFVITVVFVVCWLPTWLHIMGFNVSKDVAHIFVLNSVVNPFIYGVASAMFREDVRQFYRQTRTKLSACYN